MAELEEVTIASLELKNAYIKAVKADFLKGTIAVSFEFSLNEETLQARKRLCALADAEAPLDLTIAQKSLQLPLPLAVDENTTTTLTAGVRSDGEPLTVDFDKLYKKVMNPDARAGQDGPDA
jgi:hypothetical protein